MITKANNMPEILIKNTILFQLVILKRRIIAKTLGAKTFHSHTVVGKNFQAIKKYLELC